jgi:aldehyde dehydrogenase (NAD+)
VEALLRSVGCRRSLAEAGGLQVRSPITGEPIAEIAATTSDQASQATASAQAAFGPWRTVPAPRRGELVRLLGDELRAAKADLGRLVTLETGKILPEGQGEVQEMIDICDFALGLSRQLYGLAVVSERAEHRLMEQWHPIGPVGVISAFNFPGAVWSWNAALALVCGNPVVWKPSDRTPLTALAVDALLARAIDRFGDAPDGLHSVLIGGRDLGQQLVDDVRLPVVSATGNISPNKKLNLIVKGSSGNG